MKSSLNNLDQQTAGYFTDGATDVRKQEIATSIDQNYQSEVASRNAKQKAQEVEKKASRRDKVKKMSTVLGATAIAAMGGVLIADSDARNQEAIQKSNAPMIERIKENVEANEMQQKAETIGADQNAATQQAEKQVIDATNKANSAEVEQNNQRIIDANR